MPASLPLMKNVLTPLAKSVLITLDAAIQKKKKFGDDCTDNLEQRIGRYHENS